MGHVPNPATLTKALKEEAARLGFSACGVARATAWDGRRPLSDWLDAGHHGSMEWMERRAEQRAAPQGLWGAATGMLWW